jgi:hypothetical protein
MKAYVCICVTWLYLVISVPAADLTILIKQIKSVGPDAAGAGPAAAAWVELKKEKLNAVVPLLTAMDDATPLAANWLRSAIDAIVERETHNGAKLPIVELQAFLNDRKHVAPARRMAFELLCQADATARDRLLTTFLDDPAAELRYDAVETAFEKLRKLPKPNPETYEPGAAEEKPVTLDKDATAVAELKKLLQASRHFEQTALIARELDAYGEKVDLTDHFGFHGRWWILASFDNTDGKGFFAVYPPEQKLDPKAMPAGKGGEATKWQFVDSKEQFGTVDLNKKIGKIKNAVAYAFTEIESDAERPVELRAASITAIKMFLNGKEVFARETYHQSFTADTHTAPVVLKKGKNTVLLKICQNDQKEPWAQDWKFQLRVTNADGSKIAVRNVTPSELN